MDIQKEIKKPSMIINIVLAIVIVTFFHVADGIGIFVFKMLMWAAFGYTIQNLVTPWLMQGFGLKDPVDDLVDQ